MQQLIREAPFVVFLAMVGIPVAMAGVCVVAALHARRQAALVRQTTAVPIGMAEDGYRQFEGAVEAIGGLTLTAPLTGWPCVWFSARVEEWTRSGASDTRAHWRTVRELTSTAPMLVRDATGACVVRVFGAEVTPTDRSLWTGSTLEPEDRRPPRVGPSESLHGVIEVAGGPNSRYRYREERIYAGDPLLVLGQYASHRFDAAPLDEDADDDVIEDEVPEDSEEFDAWDRVDQEQHDRLDAVAAAITRAEIAHGGRAHPLIVSTTPSATHVYMNEMGSQAALMVALVPLGLAALVLLARFS